MDTHELKAVPDPPARQNPKPRPTDRTERTAQRMLRLIGFGFVVSMILNVVLVVAFTTIFPLVRIQPALVQFENEQFIQIDPIFEGSTGETKMREYFARNYVKNRETIDLVGEDVRWGKVRQVSHPSVWEPFITRMQQDRVWAKMERDGITQEINVLGSWNVFDDPDRWQVEFERIQRRDFDVVDRSVWVATFWYGRIEGPASEDAVFENPFRLRVDRYTISAKQSLQEN